MTVNTLVSIHLFRHDLRLLDNPALSKAAESKKVLPVYILSDQLFNGSIHKTDAPKQAEQYGSASAVWLHHALKSLDHNLDGGLNLFRGDTAEILIHLCKITAATLVTHTKSHFPHEQKADEKLAEILAEKGISFQQIDGNLLWHAEDTLKSDGTPYKVFTPFYRRGCLSAPEPRVPLPAPQLDLHEKVKGSLELSEFGLLPQHDWDENLASQWDISEQGAHNRLEKFIASEGGEGLADYAEGRNFPAQIKTSRLSPYLKFGQISAHSAWHKAAEKSSPDDKNLDIFRSELGWREFSYSLLNQFPTLKSAPLQPKFASFRWEKNAEHLLAWQQGRTGYPIVDAGMRELYQTGFMHNRLRMIVGSFLVKNLLLDWREGEAWFWDCLFDADAASNRAGWQWIAGCGADAAPYFRVFNPITQGQKFDPEGHYTRRFVPELAELPNKYLFNPFDAPAEVLKRAGVVLGSTYPHPLVDAKLSRLRALDRFAELSPKNA